MDGVKAVSSPFRARSNHFLTDAGHSLDQFPAQTNIGKGAIASLEPDLEWFVAPTNDGLYELT